MDIDGSTHLVDPKNCKRMGLYKCYMNFYKIFYFNFYMFFFIIWLLYCPLIIIFKFIKSFKKKLCISLQSSACFEPRLLEDLALKCVRYFYSLSQEFVRYDGLVLDPFASLQFTRRTYYTLVSNIKRLAKDLCGGWCVLFLEGGYNLKSVILSGRFIQCFSWGAEFGV